MRLDFDAPKATEADTCGASLIVCFHIHNAAHKQQALLIACIVCAGTVAIAGIALVGDVPSAITTFKTTVPWLVVPTKALVAFPIVYHYAGGIRHLIWDQAEIGKQADKTSFLENEAVDRLSWGMLGVSAVGTVILGFTSFS